MSTPNDDLIRLRVKGPALPPVVLSSDPNALPIEPLRVKGPPLPVVNLTNEPVVALFDLRELRAVVGGVGTAVEKVRRWCEEQWTEEEHFLRQCLGSAPTLDERIKEDRESANWRELTRQMLASLESEISRREDIGTILAQLPSLEYVVRDCARCIWARRITVVLRSILVQNGVALLDSGKTDVSVEQLLNRHSAARF